MLNCERCGTKTNDTVKNAQERNSYYMKDTPDYGINIIKMILFQNKKNKHEGLCEECRVHYIKWILNVFEDKNLFPNYQ